MVNRRNFLGLAAAAGFAGGFGKGDAVENKTAPAPSTIKATGGDPSPLNPMPVNAYPIRYLYPSTAWLGTSSLAPIVATGNYSLQCFTAQIHYDEV